MCDYAVRDIAAGEELTNDYSTFHDSEVLWLQDLMQQFCPCRFQFMAQIRVVCLDLAPEDDVDGSSQTRPESCAVTLKVQE